MNQVFNSSFARTDTALRANHGAYWSQSDEAHLKRMFLEGHTLKEMAEELGRKGDAVLKRLHQNLKLLTFDPIGCKYYYRDEPNNFTVTQHIKEETMNKTNLIETKTFIQGDDAANMTDAQIFALIAKKEQEIDKLCAIKVKSTKLKATIESMQADVDKLAKFVDERV